MKIEIEAEQFGDWAFPVGEYATYYKSNRVPLTRQQSLFLLILARSGDTIRNRELVARVSPGAEDKLGHVLASNIRKRLTALDIEPPFDNMFDRSNGLAGVPRAKRKGHRVSGYKWIG